MKQQQVQTNKDLLKQEQNVVVLLNVIDLSKKKGNDDEACVGHKELEDPLPFKIVTTNIICNSV